MDAKFPFVTLIYKAVFTNVESESSRSHGNTVEGLGFVCFVGFERDLQHSVPEAVSVQAGDGHGGLVVVSHGDKTKSFTLVCVEVTDHLHVGDRSERAEHLPQDALVCVRRQVVDKDAPPGPSVAWEVDARQAGDAVDSHRGEPAVRQRETQRLSEDANSSEDSRGQETVLQSTLLWGNSLKNAPTLLTAPTVISAHI